MTAEQAPETTETRNASQTAPTFTEPSAAEEVQPQSAVANSTEQTSVVELTPQNESTQPQQRDTADVERQRRARAAAIAAIAHAAPGQRERVMNEAIAAATASVPEAATPQAQPQCEDPSHVC
jgi:hypothetical protein